MRRFSATWDSVLATVGLSRGLSFDPLLPAITLTKIFKALVDFALTVLNIFHLIIAMQLNIPTVNRRLFVTILYAFFGGAFVSGGICLMAHAPGYGVLFFFGGIGSLIMAIFHKEKR
jgi:hypothetical protein